MSRPPATRRDGGARPRILASSSARGFAALAAALAGLAVAIGAFGAHALADRVTPDRLDTFATAVRYQMWHALGVLALLGLEVPTGPAVTLLVGSSVFAGSLYVLVLTDTSWLGAVAPLGGVLMIVGWVWAAASLLRR